MARRGDRDARGEVEEEVSVDVLDRQAVPADRHDRVRPRQAGRGPRLIECDMGPRLGAGQLGDEVRDGSIAGEPRRGRGQGTPLVWVRVHNEYAEWISAGSIADPQRRTDAASWIGLTWECHRDLPHLRFDHVGVRPWRP